MTHLLTMPTLADAEESDVRERVRVEQEIHRISQRLAQLQQERSQQARATREGWPQTERRYHDRRRR